LSTSCYENNSFWFIFGIDNFLFVDSFTQGISNIVVGNGKRNDGTDIRLNWPRGIAIDQQTRNLFITESNVIKKISQQGMISGSFLSFLFFLLLFVSFLF
jgi:hypothetical protein